MILGWAVGSAIVVSLVSVIAAIPLILKKETPKKTLLFLLSVSVGTFLGAVFLQLLPEAASHGYTVGLALNIIYGFLAFFVIEKIIHYHHTKKCEHNHVHGHAYHLAPLTLIGDGIHNFVDGLAIAASYAISIEFGIAATIAIILHELPQEIADIGILLHSKVSKKKAILFNFISAITAIVGAVLGSILIGSFRAFNEFIIPFISGVFIYIAAANLVPELHRHCNIKESLLHVAAISLGVAIIAVLVIFGPAHAH